MLIENKILTHEDVELLNNDRNSIVILNNTVGQSVDVLKQLSSKVKIQIIGGYNAEKKPKYAEKRIQERTFYTPSEVCAIIEKFEEYEKGIDHSWNKVEKALFMYKQFAENINFHDNKDLKSRNLNTILGEGVCAGYSIVFKEAMDRLGIECDVINIPKTHTWNALKIDGKWYPLDLTWEANNIQNKGISTFEWFGQNPSFDKYGNHNAVEDVNIPNNCFDPKMIANALNKITNSNNYEPIEQKILLSPDVSININVEKDINTILESIRPIAIYASENKHLYNDSAFIEEYDSKFLNIIQSLKSNPNLNAEDKKYILKLIDNLWGDVFGETLGVKNSLNQEIAYSLRLISSIKTGNFTGDKEWIEKQMKKIHKQCEEFGILDIEKLKNTATQLKQKLEEMKETEHTL